MIDPNDASVMALSKVMVERNMVLHLIITIRFSFDMMICTYPN